MQTIESLFGETKLSGRLASPGLSMDDALADAGCKVLRYRFDWAGGRAAWTMNTPEDATPQRIGKLRVATRRMRNDLRLFRRGYRDKVLRPTAKGLRALSSALRPVRACDAQLANLGDYYARCDDEARTGLTPLMEHWQARRAAASAKLLALMASDAYQDWLEGLDGLFSNSNSNVASQQPNHDKRSRMARKAEPGEPSRVRHVARAVVGQHLAEVRAFDTLPDSPPAGHIHALRLAIKRLRYALEALREVLPSDETQQLLQDCIAAQDAYGAINDVHVAATQALQFVSRQRSARGESRAATRVPRITRVALRGIVTYAEAQQKVYEARSSNWRDFLQPFL